MSSIAARLSLILDELRLPTIKRLWAGLAEQSNKEGWPAERFLTVVMEHRRQSTSSRLTTWFCCSTAIRPCSGMTCKSFSQTSTSWES